MPEDARLQVRSRRYGNRAEEDAAVRTIDQQVWAKVRFFESGLVKQSAELNDRHRRALVEAAEISTELRALESDIAGNVVALNEATAREWQQLSQRAELNQEQLDRLSRDADHIASALDDPYAAYQRLIERFPAIRPDLDL